VARSASSGSLNRRAYRQEEAGPARNPLLPPRREAAAGNDAVHVRIMRERRARLALRQWRLRKELQATAICLRPEQHNTSPACAAVQHCSIADMAFSCPRLSRTFCRHTDPCARKTPATSGTAVRRVQPLLWRFYSGLITQTAEKRPWATEAVTPRRPRKTVVELSDGFYYSELCASRCFARAHPSNFTPGGSYAPYRKAVRR
jgi:hypothetical protein